MSSRPGLGLLALGLLLAGCSLTLYTASTDGSNLKKVDTGIPHGEFAWYQR